MRTTHLSLRWIGAFCVGLASLILVRPIYATSLTFDAHLSTCDSGCEGPWPGGTPPFPSVHLDAQIRTEEAYGTFWDAAFQSYFSTDHVVGIPYRPGPITRVVDVTGMLTYEGVTYPVSFQPAPRGDGSWLYGPLLGNLYATDYLVFSAGGYPAEIQGNLEVPWQWFIWEAPDGQWGDQRTPVHFSAQVVAVPETASSVTLLTIALSAVLFWHHRLRNAQ